MRRAPGHLSAACAFSRHGGREGWRLWVSVVLEHRVAASLICSAHLDLAAPWCSEVSLFCASLWGGAVVAASIPAAVVKEAGRCSDHWRCSRRQEFDAAPRSLVDGRSGRSAQQTRQPLSSSLPLVPDETWGPQLHLKTGHKWAEIHLKSYVRDGEH